MEIVSRLDGSMNMDILWWILIIACFVLAFVGIVFPIIPAVLVIWVGFFSVSIFIDNRQYWLGLLDCNGHFNDYINPV